METRQRSPLVRYQGVQYRKERTQTVARNPDHYAIVIGIDGYSQLRRLRASGKDATRFVEWLSADDGGGLDVKHIVPILSPPTLPVNEFAARPIQVEIDEALAQLGVENGGHLGERLYFYFAGHGFGPTFDEVGMLMANANQSRLRSNIGLRPFRTFFHATGLFDEVIYVLDCCRDIVGGIETNGPVFTLPPVNGAVARTQEFVVMAAVYGEKAFQPVDVDNDKKNERRGLLTQAVLEALKGAPRAFDARGRVTASTMCKYVERRVPELATEAKLQQKPQIELPTNDLVLAALSADVLPKVHVHVVAPPNLAGTLVLQDGTDPLEQHDAALATQQAPWVIKLLYSNSSYSIKHVESNTTIVLNLDDAVQDPHLVKFPRPQ
jgi:hypothetical protein